MIISTSLIKELNPCSDRFNNFTTHNPNFSGSIEEFKNCNHITQEDISWVFSRILNYQQLINELTQEVINLMVHESEENNSIHQILIENSTSNIIAKYSNYIKNKSVLSQYLAQICLIKWHYSDKSVPIRDAQFAFHLKNKLIDELSQN